MVCHFTHFPTYSQSPSRRRERDAGGSAKNDSRYDTYPKIRITGRWADTIARISTVELRHELQAQPDASFAHFAPTVSMRTFDRMISQMTFSDCNHRNISH